MKTNLLTIAATLLLAASVNTAFARWTGNSAVCINGTWYYCANPAASLPVDGVTAVGAFDGADLGHLENLTLGGKSEVYTKDGDNWGQGTMTMGYKIDGGNDVTFNLDYYGYDNNNNKLKFLNKVIDISDLSVGNHTIEVWFLSEDAWDSNNSHNYKATFYTGPVIELNSTANNSSILSANTGADVNVIINNYTLYKDGKWNTLCLPFNLSGAQLGATQLKDVDIWKLNNNSSYDQSTGSLVLNFVHQEGDNYKFEAGVPYLVKWNNHGEPIVNPLFKGVTIANDNPGSTGGTNVSFVGTYTSESYESDIKNRYFLGADNTLYYVGPGTSINAFHAYFELTTTTTGPDQIKSFVLNFDDDNETTSIKQINNTESATSTWFTLDGRRLNDKPATAGLYIINGKKVVIK